MAVVVQMSDPHVWRRGEMLYDELDTAALLRAAVRSVNGLERQPDLVVLSGDLVNDATPHEYEHVVEILSELRSPWKAIGGNHDDPATAAAALAPGGNLFDPMHYGWSQPCSGVVDLPEVRLVGLISGRFGVMYGTLDDADLEAARQALSDRPGVMKIVVVHHPPVPVGIAAMDEMRLDERSSLRLGEIVRETGVTAVWCGHLHRATVTPWCGAIVASSPSTAHSIASDFRPDAPLTVSDEPPGFVVHSIDGERLSSHVCSVGEYTHTVVDLHD